MRYRIVLVWVLSALLFGCTSATTPPGADPGAPKVDAGVTPQAGANPGGTSSPTPTPIQTAPILPAKPIWPEPGAHFADEAGHGLAHAYTPFLLKGRAVVPVLTPERPILISQDGDKVYLVGTHSLRGGIDLLPEPQLLYRLPLTVGQEWAITFDPSDRQEMYTYQVSAITEGDTPAGKQPLVTVEVSGKSIQPRTQVWAPGYGLIQQGIAGKTTYTATKLMKEEPKPFPAVGHPTPEMIAIFVDAGPDEVLIDSTGKELGRIPMPGVRDSVFWQRVGEVEFAWQASPVSAMSVAWSAYAYDAGQFKRVRWTAPDWNQPYLPVSYDSKKGDRSNVEIKPDGTILYQGTGALTGKTYVYRWDSKALAFQGELQN